MEEFIAGIEWNLFSIIGAIFIGIGLLGFLKNKVDDNLVALGGGWLFSILGAANFWDFTNFLIICSVISFLRRTTAKGSSVFILEKSFSIHWWNSWAYGWCLYNSIFVDEFCGCREI